MTPHGNDKRKQLNTRLRKSALMPFENTMMGGYFAGQQVEIKWKDGGTPRVGEIVGFDQHYLYVIDGANTIGINHDMVAYIVPAIDNHDEK